MGTFLCFWQSCYFNNSKSYSILHNFWYILYIYIYLFTSNCPHILPDLPFSCQPNHSSTHTFICISILLSVHQSIHLSVIHSSSVYLSVKPSFLTYYICLSSIGLSSIYLFVIYSSIYLFVIHSFIYRSVIHSFIYLSVIHSYICKTVWRINECDSSIIYLSIHSPINDLSTYLSISSQYSLSVLLLTVLSFFVF